MLIQLHWDYLGLTNGSIQVKPTQKSTEPHRFLTKLGHYIVSVETFTHSQFHHYMLYGFRVRANFEHAHLYDSQFVPIVAHKILFYLVYIKVWSSLMYFQPLLFQKWMFLIQSNSCKCSLESSLSAISWFGTAMRFGNTRQNVMAVSRDVQLITYPIGVHFGYDLHKHDVTSYDDKWYCHGYKAAQCYTGCRWTYHPVIFLQHIYTLQWWMWQHQQMNFFSRYLLSQLFEHKV